MIITPHLLIGAAIGAKVKNIGWIIILGIISHIILDKIPHWDYGEKLEKFPHDKFFAKNLMILFSKMTLDGFVGLIILAMIIWQKNIFAWRELIYILIGICSSLFPDFILGTFKLIAHTKKFKKISEKYISFHDQFMHFSKHIQKPTLLGLGTEILIGIIAILILLF